jgi:hypothetical protein
VKELNGAGGYEPGELIVDRTYPITNEEWDQFAGLIEQACYWRQPTEDNEMHGEDGAQWILEGAKGGRYHIVDRWSPNDGSYRETCLYLLKLSRLGIATSSKELY